VRRGHIARSYSGACLWAPLFAFATLTAAYASAQLKIDLVPPFVDKAVRPGSTVRDVIVFRNQGTKALEVEVETVDFEVDSDGRVVERPPGSSLSSLVPYIRISPLQAVVAPGQEVAFRWEAETPDDLVHRRVMVFFKSTPQVERTGPAQVVMVPRLGIPVYVESVTAAAAKLEVASVDVVRLADQEDRLRLSLDVTNVGQRNLRPRGELRVRSTSGEAVAFPINEGRDSVIPQAQRHFVHEYGPVPGGELSVQVVLDVSPRERHSEQVAVPAASSASASRSP
jgi:hypothetical protein